MQRSQRLRSSQESAGPRSRRARAASAARRTASGVSAGSRPSGGSMMSELRRDRAVRFSYQCEGPAPTAPPSATAAIIFPRASSAFSRSAPSSNALPANSAGRSSGTEKLLSLVQTPPRSGSPHGVLACVQGRDWRSVAARCRAVPAAPVAIATPTVHSSARIAIRRCRFTTSLYLLCLCLCSIITTSDRG